VGKAVVCFRSHFPTVLYLTGIFFLNILSRTVLAPLMPTIEGDLNIGHGEAGSFFLFISLGYFTGLLGSGVVSFHLTHKRTIVLSSIGAGGALLAVSFSHTLWGIRSGLIFLGLSAGLYLPSGIAILTATVNSKDWGKALAFHQLSPIMNLNRNLEFTQALDRFI
jgi:NNP family nitrate/nitrite transporter-like MFS transporter